MSIINYLIVIVQLFTIGQQQFQQTKMNYNFRAIKVIPPANDLVNIILSKTQRKTPTVVHPGYAISRIRSFYMRKIKFCEDTISEKLSNVLDTFPKIEDIHPFYADLFNVLYDKDHYKLALGHIKATKNMIQNMTKDYLKLVKYGDSLYRCKCLKRAALGRICTMVRKMSSSLAYLEQVRKHLIRLPSINPYQRTILLSGYPNVGKSSFINRISRANVEVQPYPFTTQALYVGHTDYKNLRYQVIDSPGVLNHELEDMNTIEMQSITALAHLKSCVLYFVDPSQQCGYSVFQQINLFNRIKPLFKNKPIIVAFNKSDLKRVSDLEQDKKAAVKQWLQKNELTHTIQMSTLQEGNLGVQECKTNACQLIINSKTSDSKIIKNEQNYLMGMYVSQPKKRDEIERPATEVDLTKVNNRPNIKKLQEQHGGAGVFSLPLQQHYVIAEEWKYDAVPEIYNGKNIADFVDADIWDKLQEIQRQQDLLFQIEGMKIEDNGQEEQPAQYQEAFRQIQRKKHLFRENHALKRNKTAYPKNKSMEQFKQTMQEKEIDPTLVEERMRNRSRSKSLFKIKEKREGNMTQQGQQGERTVRNRIREASRSRSKGYQREMSNIEIQGKKEHNKLTKKWRLKDKKGQSDRFIGSSKPKHLFSGKSSNGKKDWR